MTEAMPFLQKTILLSYDPRPFRAEDFILVKTWKNEKKERIGKEKNEV